MVETKIIILEIYSKYRNKNLKGMTKDIEPIDNLNDLLKWKDRQDIGKEYQEELINFKKSDEAEVLLCHDMRGGYLPEERKQGKYYENGKQPYMFLNWWQIDIFNYFSHHLVTIPPEDYTRIAHRHGVLSLGTFITEWIPGSEICKQIMENEESVNDTVNSLVAVARFYGFDGWLINIENEIEPENVEKLLKFIEKLTTKMRINNENSRVIWYDSVLHNGELKWQNCLNEKNCKFYNACDGIYLNYNWTDQHLLNSADLGRLNKIFVGIDVWARGCLGGYDCWKSFSVANLLHMSVALFAPGWIHETNPDGDQIALGIDFWRRLHPYLRTRKFNNANFSTSFCSGMIEGDGDGKNLYQLSNVSLQPQKLTKNSRPIVGNGLALYGERTSFVLFDFDSIPVSKYRIVIEADDNIDLYVNDEKIVSEVVNNLFVFETTAATTLEQISITTKNQQRTVVKYFEISSE